MHSSTSSFRTEAKVLGIVLLVLALVELGVHLFERRLADGTHTPTASQKLMEGEGRRILVLGNSLVRDGVDARIVEEDLRAQNVGPVRVEQAYMSAATGGDLYYIFKHAFADTGRLPDTLVLGFAFSHLQDLPIQRHLIAHYYSGATDIPQIFAEEVKDFDGRVEFLLFGGSLSFAHRVELQRRVSDVLIPHYRESALRINKALTEDPKKMSQPPQPSYRNLTRLIDLARNHDVHVILVAMPTQKQYEIPSQMTELINARGLVLLDSRDVEGLGAEYYGDELHLNQSGKTLYSHFLARKLVEVLSRKDTGSSL